MENNNVNEEKKDDINKEIDDTSSDKESVESTGENTEVSNEEISSEKEGEVGFEDSEPAFKIKALENKLKDQEESFMRLNAEYQNFRRRTQEEKSSIALYANEKIMNDLILVVDNFERALDSIEDKESQTYKGVEMVSNQLMDSLKRAGLETIEANVGDDFDHNFHMAVMQEESSEYEPGKILMVLQKGYKIGKKVLRASMVKVSC